MCGCDCAAGEKTEKTEAVSHSARVLFKVDPREHILVIQMNHQQQGVAARCPPAPPAHVSLDGEAPNVPKTATLMVLRRVCVFRLPSLISL